MIGRGRARKALRALFIALVLLVALVLTFRVSRAILDATESGAFYKQQRSQAADESYPGRVERIRVTDAGTVEYQRLFRVQSEPGESLDTFMVRIAPRLVAFSEATGFEACGAIGSDGSRFGVVIGSNRAHVACASFNRHMPEGMTPVGQTIHSHGNGAARLNRNDLRFLGLPEGPRSQRMFGTVYGQDRYRFSERDKSGGPGYLATPTGLLHHDGKGEVRTVSP